MSYDEFLALAWIINRIFIKGICSSLTIEMYKSKNKLNTIYFMWKTYNIAK